jgi:hypothetical protein
MYLKEEIKNSKFPVYCPGAKCKLEMQIEDLRELMNDAEIEKFYNFTLNKFVEEQ